MVLHLFSNCKWTGPAEPALNLCCALREEGVDTEFACAPDAGDSVNMVVESARARGVDPILDFHLRKHRHPFKNLQDVRKLRQYLRENDFDLVHCHLDNDHAIAARALRGSKIPLVRSNYEGLGLKGDRRHQYMLDRTALLLEPSEIARDHDARTFGLSGEQVTVVPGAIDTERFDPARPLTLEDTSQNVAQVEDAPGRASRLCTSAERHETAHSLTRLRSRLGIPHDDAYVVGIVARMQTHRHFEDLLDAMKRLIDVMPQAHLVIVGRGTNQKAVVEIPAHEMGIADHVHITGYVEGDDLVAAIQAFDVGVYLVPGSDGTCRAAREILSMGKPLVVADRGMLREIVVDGESGVVCDGSPKALLDTLQGLGQDAAHRQAMGKNARSLAEERYALGAQAKVVKGLYEGLM